MEQKNQQNTVFDSLSYENDIYTNNYFIDPFTNTKIMVEIFFKITLYVNKKFLTKI